MKTKRIKYDTQPGWFCDEIKSMIFQRDKFHRDGDFEQYKILRNKLTATIKRHNIFIFSTKQFRRIRTTITCGKILKYFKIKLI